MFGKLFKFLKHFDIAPGRVDCFWVSKVVITLKNEVYMYYEINIKLFLRIELSFHL